MRKTKFAPIAPLFETDSYKVDHIRQYPQGTEVVYSNFTNRGSRIEGVNHVVAFGLQAFIKKYIEDAFIPFFAADEDEVCELYAERVATAIGGNKDEVGTDHIRALHRKGYLPLHFRAVKEGTLVPLRVPTFTVENTEPEFFWLTNYIETVLSASVWYPSTSATKAVMVRSLIEKWAAETGGAEAFIDWQWHDFSFRGQTTPESAAASGAAHLLTFTGTDNLNSFEWIDSYYPGDNGFVGGSVFATEHSVMCAGTAHENELETYRRLLTIYPTGIVSVVSDTYDLWNVLTNILPTLKDDIMGRDGKLVIRPDSGDPADILCGGYEVAADWQQDWEEIQAGKPDTRTPAQKGVIELLWETFGGTVNEKGYKTLDPHIGAIYGDSITVERAENIFRRLAAKGFASDNIVFGAGSYFYQGNTTRDTFGSAMKATWVQIDNEGLDILKDPVTDNGTKKSATGRLAVLRDENDELVLVQQATAEQEADSELATVWKDGAFVREQSFADVRAVLKDEVKRVYR